MNETNRNSGLLTQQCLSYIQKATVEAFDRYMLMPQNQKVSRDSVVDAAIQMYLAESTLAQAKHLSLQGNLNVWFPAHVQRSTMEKLSRCMESRNLSRDVLVDFVLQLYLAEYSRQQERTR